MEWQAARRILIVAFLLFDALLFVLRFGPGEALVPSVSGTKDLSSLVLTNGLDLNARPLRATAAVPVLKVSTYPADLLVFDVLGVLPGIGGPHGHVRSYRVRGVTVERVHGGTVRFLFPAGKKALGRALTVADAERIAARLLARWQLGVTFGPMSAALTPQGGAVVSIPEVAQAGGYPIYGAGITLTLQRGGALAAVRSRLLQVLGRRRPNTPLIPGAGAIVTWAQSQHLSHPLVVEGVRLGYWLPPAAHGIAFELDPTWLVTLRSGQTVGIDALTEEIER
jgi:hypothetical protein